MAQFSWVPGLPTLVSRDIWFVDSDPYGKQLSEYKLVFLVEYKRTFLIRKTRTGGFLLANRCQYPVQLEPPGYVTQINHEKQYMEIDGRTHLIKRLEYTPDIESSTTLPDELVGVDLPPTKMTVDAD